MPTSLGPAAKSPATSYVVAAISRCCVGTIQNVVTIEETRFIQVRTGLNQSRQHLTGDIHTARQVKVLQPCQRAINIQCTVKLTYICILCIIECLYCHTLQVQAAVHHNHIVHCKINIHMYGTI